MVEIRYNRFHCCRDNHVKNEPYNILEDEVAIRLDRQRERFEEMSKEMVRLFNYFQDYFKDSMDEMEFHELWKNIKEGVYEHQD